MATYAEIFALRNHSELKNKIAVAVAVKAQALIDAASPTAAQIEWAQDAIVNPESKAGELLNYVLAKNKALTTTQITEAADSAIQTQVSDAVDKLIAGGV